jgi:hypothetical protein
MGYIFTLGFKGLIFSMLSFLIVPDRPLVRVPIRTLLEYSYELGIWDFDPVHILILIEV